MDGGKGGSGATNGRWLAVAIALGLATVGFAAVPASALASSTPAIPASPSETIWAYGAVVTTSVSWQGLSGGFQGTVTYGFSAVLTRTNTSSTTFTLAENRTVGDAIHLTYCRPDCTQPRVTATYSDVSYETVTSTADLSTGGTVVLANNTSVPALALLAVSTAAAANVSQTLYETRNGTTSLYAELFVNATASDAIAFAPGLGLFPLNLSANETWSSGSAFAATGSYSTSYFGVGPRGNTGTVANSGTLSSSGNLTLYGGDRTGVVRLDGRTLRQIALRLGTPTIARGAGTLAAGLDLADGFAFVPRLVDVFQTTGSWGSSAALTTSASPTAFDAATTGDGIAVQAASYDFSSSASILDTASGSTATVQAAPMTPAAAAADSACLQSGTCASAGATGAGVPLAALVGGLVLVAVVAGVAMLVYTRRRPMGPG